MTASKRPVPAGVILAGGRSSRMNGQNKAQCLVGGKPLAAWCAARLHPQVASLALNCNETLPQFSALQLPLLADPIPGHPGPLGGILAALDWAHGRHAFVATVAVDTPFFPDDLVAQLERASGNGAVAVAASNGRIHPVFALWPSGLRDELRGFLQEGETGRVMAFLERVGLAPVEFASLPLASGSLDPFFNINTPEDLALAQALGAELAT